MNASKIITFLKTYRRSKRLYKMSIQDPEKFRIWQESRRKKHMEIVLQKSAYYRSIEKIDGTFPITDKTLMMDHFDELNTVGISLQHAREIALQSEVERDFTPKIGKISVGLSSGTTGNQGVFLISNDEIVQWSASVIAKLIHFKKFKRQKITIAFFMRANNNLYESINNPKMSIHFFDLLEPLADNLRLLDDLQPNIIVAQPSMLRLIAQHYERQKRNYDLKEIYSIAEVLDPVDEAFISEAMDAPVKQVYQATEGFLAVSCQYGNLHLNEDIVYIEKEYIDAEKRRFIPIITDLFRISQPLIRYRLNDILVEAREPCPCGTCFTTLEAIEGREDDCFALNGRDGETVTLFADFIRYAIINASDKIIEYRAVQKLNGQIEVQLNVEADSFIQVQEKINENFAELFIKYGAIPVKIHYQNRILLSENRKMRRVEREK
ncbi:adenylate cyclase [Listeria booriae]|nr:adenylate cyclase [Listeria booriae]